jgi:hypothetical protein
VRRRPRPPGHEPSSNASSSGHGPSGENGGSGTHEPSGENGGSGSHESAGSKYSTFQKVIGKDKFDHLRDFKGIQKGLKDATGAVKDAGSDLPKSYVKWTKDAYQQEIGSVGDKVAGKGLQTVRKVLYIRERVEAVNHTGNLIDQETTGHGNPIERQDNGKTIEDQAWTKLSGTDEAPKWVDPLEDLLGVGG